MTATSPLTPILRSRLDEDLGVLLHLLEMLPWRESAWRPPWPATNGAAAFSLGDLAHHCVDAAAAHCACMARLHQPHLDHFAPLREQLAALAGTPSPALRDLLLTCRSHILEAWERTLDSDLHRPITSHFHPEGIPFLDLLLLNQKHLHHHTYQLFLYLKHLGIPLSTPDLYALRTMPS